MNSLKSTTLILQARSMQPNTKLLFILLHLLLPSLIFSSGVSLFFETSSMQGLILNCMDRKSEAYELVRLGLKVRIFPRFLQSVDSKLQLLEFLMCYGQDKMVGQDSSTTGFSRANF